MAFITWVIKDNLPNDVIFEKFEWDTCLYILSSIMRHHLPSHEDNHHEVFIRPKLAAFLM